MYNVKYIETCGTKTISKKMTALELEELEYDLDYEIITFEKVGN